MNKSFILSYRGLVSLILAFHVLTPTVLASPLTVSADESMSQGSTAFQRGHFDQAALNWQQANALYSQADQFKQQIEALIRLADAYQALGQPQSALQAAKLAKTLEEKTEDQTQTAAVLGSLGKAYWLTGAVDEARQHLESSITLARQTGNNETAAASLNHLGNLLFDRRDYAAVQTRYRESLVLARQSKDQALTAKVLINLARATLRRHDEGHAESLLKTALQQTRALPDSHDKAYGLIALGQLYRELPTAQARWRLLAQQTFTEAAAMAEALNDQRTLSYALGYLAQLYQQAQRYTEALQLNRQAAFAAQQAQAPEILYRWQWQIARLLKAQGDIEAAILAYRQAVTEIQAVRPALAASYERRHLSFREAAGDAFFELADLLLQQAAQSEDSEQSKRTLIEARDTMEQLRTTELKDYFQDDCVVALQSRITELEQPPPRTAILYPILLQERTVLLLSLPQGIKQFQVVDPDKRQPIDRETLTQTVREFRHYLEKRTTREYLATAQRLYRWLIEPLHPVLQAHQIHTLVVVPDGPLRTIPLAALHDGTTFLIQQYAIAITPGLTLTDLNPIRYPENPVLLTGLTQSVQGFPALRFVDEELKAIDQLYTGTTVEILKNERFRATNLQRELTATPYSLVHIASHGWFTGNVKDTFLLTFDGKITMDGLEGLMSLGQYREQPVELLTLSACETAAGDERAALGLAGIAVKAGARSAVATLWSTNDQAAYLVITEFYRQLQNPALSKVKALQQAQLKLLDDRRFRHPGYWSPFLIIGNWL